MIIFDGKAFAARKEMVFKKQVDDLHAAGKTIRVNTVTFTEDEGSRLYTSLKQKAAQRIGILYEPIDCSLSDDTGELIEHLRGLSYNASVTGVMIQKPAKSTWETHNDKRATVDFSKWWESLTSALDPQKDVDCLTQYNLDAVYRLRTTDYRNTLLPATVRACVSILQQAKHDLDTTDEVWQAKSVLVIGRSDIVGKPLTHVLRSMGHTVVNVGREEFSIFNFQFSKFDIVISATGQENIVKGDMINEEAVVIDVGSPSPEIERFSVENKAAFLTPVPGGVGPVTVVSLMENILKVANK